MTLSTIVIIFTCVSIFIIATGIILYFIRKNSNKGSPINPVKPVVPPPPVKPVVPPRDDTHTIFPKKPQNDNSKIIIAYLNSVFPQSNNFESLDPETATKFYDSLMWYYLPLVRQINKNKIGPLKGPYKDATCQWFMADGTDCGDFITDPKKTGTFTCSVFGGACDTWEFGKSKDGGKPYQYAAFIQPYNMRNGCPSNGYIECVAFACEALGRMLLSPQCSNVAPTWDDFIKNRKNIVENYKDLSSLNCPNKNNCDTPKQNDAGCKVGSTDMVDICCWDYKNDKPDDSVCPFPAKCMADKGVVNGVSTVFGNYCATPCGYVGCDATNGCTWNINGKNWEDALKGMKSGKISSQFIVKNLQMKAQPFIGDKQPLPRNDKSVQKTMFYWCKGYGKFLDMGLTGVYFSYVHFLLTCPKISKDGKTAIRWSYPQILQAATLNGGNSTMIKQLEALIDGSQDDNRQFLEGYVTTLKGKEYEGVGGEDIDNKMVYKTENVGGLVNPLDDNNLKNVDKYTVTRYYNPDKKIKNPQYKKKINYTPIQAIYMQQGMHIYGATSSSIEHPFVNLSHGGNVKDTLGHTGSGTWPFGVFFEGATLGGCVYKMINMLGWKSAQFTQMPTGAGGAKYCNSPEFDFEIVYIADKNAVCKSEMKMLDPIIDINNYINNGFIDGNKFSPGQLNVVNFNANIMSLTERNVPNDWSGLKPNELVYKSFNNNQDIKTTDYKAICPYKDNVFNK